MKAIRFYEPEFGEKERQLVNTVLDSGMVSEGQYTKILEERLSKIVKTKHVIMTNNCTAALYLAIEADKRIRKYSAANVVMPALTMNATMNAIKMAGLSVLIQDVDNKSFMLRQRKDYKDDLIVHVNLLGRSRRHKNPVIYDNAGCLGSNVPNGLVGCYSLQANKIISSGGQGGFCATNSDEYARVIRQIKDFGRKDKHDNDTDGFNFKFNDVQAAIGLAQLDKLHERKRLLLRQYKIYRAQLSEYGDFIPYAKGEIPLWIEFFTNEQRELLTHLELNNIYPRLPWKPIIDYPNAEHYYRKCLWLPSGPKVTDKDLLRVVHTIKDYYEQRD